MKKNSALCRQEHVWFGTFAGVVRPCSGALELGQKLDTYEWVRAAPACDEWVRGVRSVPSHRIPASIIVSTTFENAYITYEIRSII
jgi:hypothetical protein